MRRVALIGAGSATLAPGPILWPTRGNAQDGYSGLARSRMR